MGALSDLVEKAESCRTAEIPVNKIVCFASLTKSLMELLDENGWSIHKLGGAYAQ